MSVFRTDREILSTQVLEMAQRRFHFGDPGRGRYHNRKWADKMEALGLMPSHTGEPGGRRVGQRVTHYILDGRPFDLASGELLTESVRVEWQSREPTKASARSNRGKTKYTCPACGLNAWARPDVDLTCGACEESLTAET